MAQCSHTLFEVRLNNPLVPTCNGEAPVLAADSRRYVNQKGIRIS
jgi:hypothetical protein